MPFFFIEAKGASLYKITGLGMRLKHLPGANWGWSALGAAALTKPKLVISTHNSMFRIIVMVVLCYSWTLIS